MSGIPFPEFTVRALVESTLNALFEDQAVRDDMLAELPEAMRDEIRTALAKRVGRVRIGWGGENVADWCITVALASTMKDAGGRGTIGDIVSRPYEAALALRTLTAELPVGDNVVAQLSQPVVVPDDVTERGLLRFRNGNDAEYATYHVASGVCTIRYRGIVETTPRVWPIGTEVMFFEWEQRDGWPEVVTLRLDVGASNPVFAITIARIVQAFIALAAGSGDFDARGYTLSECNATDLAPRPPIWPENFYNRTLQVQVRTTLSLPERYPGIADTQVTVTTE